MKRVEDLQQSIIAIESSIFHKFKRGNGGFELIAYTSILTNLSGNCGALFVRAVLQKLLVNEHQVLQFRLENKYKQYQVFNHYYPGCMPETLAFSELLAQSEGEQKIRDLFDKGYFLKKLWVLPHIQLRVGIKQVNLKVLRDKKVMRINYTRITFFRKK